MQHRCLVAAVIALGVAGARVAWPCSLGPPALMLSIPGPDEADVPANAKVFFQQSGLMPGRIPFSVVLGDLSSERAQLRDAEVIGDLFIVDAAPLPAERVITLRLEGLVGVPDPKLQFSAVFAEDTESPQFGGITSLAVGTVSEDSYPPGKYVAVARFTPGTDEVRVAAYLLRELQADGTAVVRSSVLALAGVAELATPVEEGAHCYVVDAVDLAGNESAPSPALCTYAGGGYESGGSSCTCISSAPRSRPQISLLLILVAVVLVARRRLLPALSIVSIVSIVSGCSDTCTVGASTPCSCAEGSAGARTCLPGGALDACRCRAASLQVAAGRTTIAVGETLQLEVRGHDASGVEWQSSDARVAAVAPDGQVTGLTVGRADVLAKSGSASGGLGINVGVTYAHVRSGLARTCAITDAGTLYCLGRDPRTGESSPLPISKAPALKVRDASLSRDALCVVSTSSAASCWGPANSADDPSPVVAAPPLRAISGGDFHFCGLDSGGLAYCWGNDCYGQLGDGASGSDCLTPAFADHAVPVAGGLSFAQIAAGAHHSCGLTAAGTAYCWGGNDAGQLGIGSMDDHATPQPVSGGISFAALSAGGQETCALTAGGEVYCWGLSRGVTEPQPRQVDSTELFDALSAGTEDIAGITREGRLCEIGGACAASTRHFRDLSLGGAHGCAMSVNGLAYCWGRETSGELGLGSRTVPSESPVPLPFQL